MTADLTVRPVTTALLIKHTRSSSSMAQRDPPRLKEGTMTAHGLPDQIARAFRDREKTRRGEGRRQKKSASAIAPASRQGWCRCAGT